MLRLFKYSLLPKEKLDVISYFMSFSVAVYLSQKMLSNSEIPIMISCNMKHKDIWEGG